METTYDISMIAYFSKLYDIMKAADSCYKNSLTFFLFFFIFNIEIAYT